MLVLTAIRLPAQTMYEYSRDDATVIFFNKNLSQNIPHLIRKYEEAKALHTGIWNVDTVGKARIQPPMIMVSDWGDDGNAGVCSIPKNLISVEMSPMNFSYFINPSVERYHHLFSHEYTHVVMSDKTASADRFWRSALGGKFMVDAQHPFAALWSFLGDPRWYVPRWYQEGIATFMETWLGGGVGRALGGYDEMYFRSLIASNQPLYSVVGIETGGSTADFQAGASAYLYGTRFVNYLEYQYGLDKLLAFYNRTEDSKALFNKQFKSVYGAGLREVWDNWREFESVHQKEQLSSLEEYPITQTEAMSEKTLGSMSPLVLDEENNCAYTAVNYPGAYAHIARIDLSTYERTKLQKIDGPRMYQTSYLALDKKNQRLIWTTQNSKFRGLTIYDINKKKVVKKLKFQRMSCIVYDNARDYMYALLTNEGKVYLCRYDSEFEDREFLYSFPFGLSVFDLDVSHDGKYVTATTSGENGEQSLIRFDVEKLESAQLGYETLYTAEDFNLGLFRFAPGDSVMVGSSYYTGVSNVWSLDLKTKELSMLTNTRIGMFSPSVLEDGRMIALEFDKDGMKPVYFTPQKIDDANAVEMLGQKAYLAHSEELENLSVSKVKAPDISFGEVYDSIKVYKPLERLRFTGAFPEIAGFRDKGAWNNVTPVLGYHFIFQDPLGINTLKLTAGLSPWSGNDPVNQYHLQVDWKYKFWSARAAWNPTSFYDLVGPVQSSRKGWQVSVSYDGTFSVLTPVVHSYGGQVAAFGMMDALPMYQEIETSDITSFQTASAYYQYSKTRMSLGGVTPEMGIEAGASAYTYLAGGRLYPSVEANLDYGFLVPIMRNTCMWLRSAVGQNFGETGSIFGNSYFGGFGNNWIDYRPANRYRSTSRFAGKSIDSIKGHSYARLMAELSLQPIRYNNVGFINLYPTYTQFNLFSTGLLTDSWEKNIATQAYVNVGIQVNTEVVLFKFMKTTWSIGYARAFNPDGTNQGDFLISLKLF